MLQSVQALTEIQDFLQFIKGEGEILLLNLLLSFFFHKSIWPHSEVAYFYLISISFCELPQAARETMD